MDAKLKTYTNIGYAWLAVYFLMGLASLTTSPPVNYNLGDEIWCMARGLELMDEAKSTGGFVESFWLHFLALSVTFKLFGFSVAAARMVSLVASVIVLHMTNKVAARAVGPEGGLFASLALGFNYVFFWHSKVVRPEILTLAVVMCAWYLYVSALEEPHKNLRRLSLSAFVMVMSIFVTTHNVQYAVGLTGLFIVTHLRVRHKKTWLYFMGGAAAGAAVFVVVSAAIMSALDIPNFAGRFQATVLKLGLVKALWASLVRLPGDYVLGMPSVLDHAYPVAISTKYVTFASLGFGVVGLLSRHRRHALMALGFLYVSWFSLYFMAQRLVFYHAVEVMPFFAILAAIGIVTIRERLKRNHYAMGVVTFMLMGVLVMPGLLDGIRSYRGFRAYDYEALLTKVSEGIPDGARVLGIDLYRPQFEKRNFVLHWFSIESPYKCPPFETSVKDRKVDYVILDDVFRYYAAGTCGEAYEQDMVRYLFVNGKNTNVVNENYPNALAEDDMISSVYIFKLPMLQQ